VPGSNNVSVAGLSTIELLAPTLFVIGGIYLLAPLLPLAKPWARFAVFVMVWLVVGRYILWRITDTVWPAQGEWYEVGWVWFCFTVEVVAFFDAFILYLTFLRVADRHAEADRYEAQLRATPQDSVPSVDVFIPTYNEPLEVLEKTITGALCLDYPNVKLWVLDDGRRGWLRDFCEAKGVGYLTRPDNSHAKAGNINHALAHTSGDYVAIFDADFIPKQNFLMRTVGFFADPKIGIVQVPHAFYNNDPMQTNLALRRTLPDDQRFFFEAILPSRDAWDAAFCCGSNAVIRRAALDAVGGALPTQSITEDVLLTLTMLRKGFVTRYLCERLAFGLAPESLSAFFVQRQRWARGAMQILYLDVGPLGRDLTLTQRLMFLPTHWVSQGCILLLAVVAPLVYLWTGLMPLVNVTGAAIIYYLVPMLLAVIGGISVYAPQQYFPFASQVLGTFQSFKILPSAFLTLINPSGQTFRVTPKGRDAAKAKYERGIFWTAASLIVLTIAGLALNTIPEWQVVHDSRLLPTVAFWGAVNIATLFLVCMMSLQAPLRRAEERFVLEEPIAVLSPAGQLATGMTRDISLSGVAIVGDGSRDLPIKQGDRVRLHIAEVGFVPGHVVRKAGQSFSVQFDLPPSIERDLLIRKLFTGSVHAEEIKASAWSATRALISSIWNARAPKGTEAPGEPERPANVLKLPARTLVVAPTADGRALAKIGAERQRLAS
jgi:cellulose synthase (UDP-forming)